MDRKKLLKPIGKLCKKARQDRGYSVSQIAEILNVTKNAIYRFERGHYDTATFLIFYIYCFDMDINVGTAIDLFMEAQNDE